MDLGRRDGGFGTFPNNHGMFPEEEELPRRSGVFARH
jgi:hypothetical protein